MSTSTTGRVRYIPLAAAVPDSNIGPEVTRIADGGIYPCRRCQSDALPGDTMRLVAYPFPIQAMDSPYSDNGPIVVHTNVCRLYSGSQIPESHLSRPISLRTYDGQHMMVDAALVGREEVDRKAENILFGVKNVEYVHAHHAAHGCFAFKNEKVMV